MLSREQKIEAYSWVISKLTRYLNSNLQVYPCGICSYMIRWLRKFIGNEEIITINLVEYFPEFTEKVSVHRFLYLLNEEGHTKRIELLKEIIKTLEKQC